jgi:PKD repeat protein
MVLLPPGDPGQETGISVAFRGREYTTGSEDDYGEVEGQIAFGTAPVADFTASPQSGSSPLSVQFENLSTPAIGSPTTYLWKKRKSGSVDPYVQFSTDENPLHDFLK